MSKGDDQNEKTETAKERAERKEQRGPEGQKAVDKFFSEDDDE